MKNAAVLAALVALSATAADFAVKPGDDVLAVRDAIRAARKSGSIASGEQVVVTFAPGTYTFAKTLLLEKVDSGTESAPVVWRAEKRGSVRIFGGRAIPRSAFVPVAGADRERLSLSARDAVRVADVSKFLVKDHPQWPDHPVGVMQGPWLYHNGESQTLARWPNLDAPDKGWAGFSNVLENCGYEADKKAKAPATIEFQDDRAARWNFAEGVWITGYLVVDWHCDTVRIASYDPATHAAKLAAVTTYGVGKGRWPFYKRRFFAQNLLEELDAEGEWYLDRKRKLLYWWPRPARARGTYATVCAEEGADEIVLAQDLAPFVEIRDASFVRLENLCFEYSHGKTVVPVSNSFRCEVVNCDFFNHGGCAVTVSGRRNRVSGCTMRNMGGQVLSLGGGSVRDLLPANNLVENCRIDNFAMYRRTHGIGITVNGCGNAARGNVVTHSPDTALNFSGNEHLIADNEFGNVVQDSGDAGCIYSGHNASWLGSIIFGNYIHDLARTPEESDARNGIYFDDCDWGDDVIGNTFVHAGRAIFFGGGKLHGAYNNLVKECLVGVHVDSRGRTWRAKGNGSFFWNPKGRAFCRYRHSEAGVEYDQAPWCVAYPALREAMDDRPEYPGMNVVTGNVFHACGRSVYGYDGGAQLVMGKSSPGNLVVTNAADVPPRAPQPIRMTDAVANRLASPDGGTVAEFIMDESGHFCWTLDVGGRHVLGRSPLGITVGYFDFGRKVVPAAAHARGAVAMKEFAQGTILVPIRNGIGFRNVSTNTADVAALSANESRIPLRSLITAETVAFLDVRVWNGGAAYRWTVPGADERMVYGENDAFMPPEGGKQEFHLVEWGRNQDFHNGYPESFYYPRGEGKGVCFPEFAHGWRHKGDVVSPWRGVVPVQ